MIRVVMMQLMMMMMMMISYLWSDDENYVAIR